MSTALGFLNLKLLKGDLDLVMDFPLFFSEDVLDLLDNKANTNTLEAIKARVTTKHNKSNKTQQHIIVTDIKEHKIGRRKREKQ